MYTPRTGSDADAFGGFFWCLSGAKHMLDVYYNFVQLGVWWALWSLADTYLLRFTPSSEIFVFSVCVFLYVHAWRADSAQSSAFVHASKTPLGSQKCVQSAPFFAFVYLRRTNGLRNQRPSATTALKIRCF